MSTEILDSKEHTKRQLDAFKIVRLKEAGHEHLYGYETWSPWTGNNYIKSFYDVQLKDGTVVEYCRPNGGVMNAPNGTKYTEEDGVKARLSKSSPI